MLERVGLIDFGRIDAKREFLDADINGTPISISSFINPPRFNLSDFILDKKCFVIGLKGTGKTALLRFIEHQERVEAGSSTDFILFKSDFSAEDRQQLSHSASFEIVDDERGKSILTQDFEDVWTLFFARILVKKVKETKEYEQNTSTVRKFVDFIESLKFGPAQRMLSILPKLRKNKIEIGVDYHAFKAKFEGDIEIPNAGSDISAAEVVGFINRTIGRMEKLSRRIVLFVDELELPYGDSENFLRDGRLIRDMIVVATRINDIFARSGSKVRIVVGVRSEVLRSVGALGKEIHKDVEDLSFSIDWNTKAIGKDQPLLNMVRKRINLSERMNGIAETDDVWSHYFPVDIDGTAPWTYLLHAGWYRPRDIVRALNGAKQFAADDSVFKPEHFELDAKSYSQAAWVEHTDELQATYSVEEIDALRRICQTLPRYFMYEEFDNRSKEIFKKYRAVKLLLDKKDVSSILEDLYRIGVVGNHWVRKSKKSNRNFQRWAFRGDFGVNLDRRMTVHRALWRELSIA